MIAPTAEVREQHRFDVAALERYLREHVAGFRGPLEVRQFRGGQSNPTYHLAAGGREYVLRRKPPGKLLPSAHAVDREYRVITALGRTDVPVPRTFVLCEDDAVIGTAFYVMDCVHGRVFSDPALLDVTPAERTAMYDSMNDVLARLHTVDPAGGRTRRLRPAGQLLQPPDPPLDAAVPRLGDRAVRLDGAPDRVAACASAVGRHHHARPTATTGRATSSSIPPSRAWPPCSTGSCRRSAIRSADLAYFCHAVSARHRVGRLPRQGSRRRSASRASRSSWRRTVAGSVARDIPDWDWYIVFAHVPPRRHRPGDHGTRDRRHRQRPPRA